MQTQNSVQLEIDHLLFELTWCVNDLLAHRRHLSSDDIRQADLSLQKLSALIANTRNQSNRPWQAVSLTSSFLA